MENKTQHLTENQNASATSRNAQVAGDLQTRSQSCAQTAQNISQAQAQSQQSNNQPSGNK